jgi:ZIP family zinc transporter
MGRRKFCYFGLLPLAAMGVFIALLAPLERLLPSSDFPPREHLSIERVQVTPKGFVATIRAGGVDEVTIAQVMVDGAYWIFEQDKPGPLARFKTAQIKINFPWIAREAHHLRFITKSGATFEHTVDVALETPTPSLLQFVDFGLLGILVGLVPIVIGMLFFPAIRALGTTGSEFSLTLTIGLLAYLFVDMTLHGLEMSAVASDIYGGPTTVFVAIGLTFVSLLWFSRRARNRGNGVQVAVLIALGIGFHNFGEGLAIGASFAANEASIGVFLIIGFALHNITEGFGIVSPLTQGRASIGLLAGLALLAGLPAAPGVWIGAFSYSPHFGALFFGVGAGAIAQVIVEIDRYLVTTLSAEGANSRFSGASVAGYCCGIAIMYGTALLITI